MRNIHILPTDKPSRLFKDDLGYYFSFENLQRSMFKNINIYITNNEEPEDGDLCLHPTTLNISQHHGKNNSLTKGWKKIILTTDLDLIADGIQEIPTDFLEWFVKNPSCESVEVKDAVYNDGLEWISCYKLIIPQDQPKQTIEEVVKELYQDNIVMDIDIDNDLQNAFVNGYNHAQTEIEELRREKEELVKQLKKMATVIAEHLTTKHK